MVQIVIYAFILTLLAGLSTGIGSLIALLAKRTNRKFLSFALGFSAGARELAYDRTVLKTGRLQWKYMDSIVRSWHGKGLHTPEEIAACEQSYTGQFLNRILYENR